MICSPVRPFSCSLRLLGQLPPGGQLRFLDCMPETEYALTEELLRDAMAELGGKAEPAQNTQAPSQLAQRESSSSNAAQSGASQGASQETGAPQPSQLEGRQSAGNSQQAGAEATEHKAEQIAANDGKVGRVLFMLTCL